MIFNNTFVTELNGQLNEKCSNIHRQTKEHCLVTTQLKQTAANSMADGYCQGFQGSVIIYGGLCAEEWYILNKIIVQIFCKELNKKV